MTKHSTIESQFEHIMWEMQEELPASATTGCSIAFGADNVMEPSFSDAIISGVSERSQALSAECDRLCALVDKGKIPSSEARDRLNKMGSVYQARTAPRSKTMIER
jgi:hypothetical protein